MKKRLLWLAVIAAALWFGWRHTSELTAVADALLLARLRWILVAGVGVVGTYGAWAWLYQSCLATVGITVPWRRSFTLTFSSLFVNTIAPTGGTGGSALFVNHSRATGQQPTATVIGYLLALFSEFVSLLMLVAVSAVLLNRKGLLFSGIVISGGVLAVIVLIMVGLLVVARFQPLRIQRWLRGLTAVINLPSRWLHKKGPLSPLWAVSTSAQLHRVATLIVNRPRQMVQNIGITLLMHLFSVGVVAAIFAAFSQPLIGTSILTAYSLMMLFWVVSPTPQGIGVVEVVGAYVLTVLGVNAGMAVVIAVAFRGVSYWIPMVVGFYLLTRVDQIDRQQRALTETWQLRVVAYLAGITGFVSIISAAIPALPDRLEALSAVTPFDVQYGGRLTAALSGFALIILSQALWRRQRTAYWATLGILVLTAVAHLVKGLDYEEAILASSVALIIFTQRRQYFAAADAPSVWRGVRVLALAIVLVVLYGAVGFSLMDAHYAIKYHFLTAVRQTVVLFTAFHDPGVHPTTMLGHTFVDSIYAMGAITGLYSLLLLFAPAFSHEPSADERQRASYIVRRYGKSPLAVISLLPDKRYLLVGTSTLVAYTDRGRAAVALGDPIGPIKEVKKAIGEFCALAKRTGREPAFYQGSGEYEQFYQRAGFASVCIGKEAMVDLATFGLEGGSSKRLRLNKRRWEAQGYMVTVLEPPFTAAIFEELSSVSMDWLDFQQGSEKRFSLGWFDEAYLQRGPIGVVLAPDGSIIAFTNILFLPHSKVVAIDLMRRHRDAASGVMEYLITDLLLWAQARGYERFSLGLSPLYGADTDKKAPIVTRLLQYAYTNMNQLYSFSGIQQFKAKFHPAWEPRYLYYREARRLPAVMHTLLRAGSGDWYYLAYLWYWLRQPIR